MQYHWWLRYCYCCGCQSQPTKCANGFGDECISWSAHFHSNRMKASGLNPLTAFNIVDHLKVGDIDDNSPMDDSCSYEVNVHRLSACDVSNFIDSANSQCSSCEVGEISVHTRAHGLGMHIRTSTRVSCFVLYSFDTPACIHTYAYSHACACTRSLSLRFFLPCCAPHRLASVLVPARGLACLRCVPPIGLRVYSLVGFLWCCRCTPALCLLCSVPLLCSACLLCLACLRFACLRSACLPCFCPCCVCLCACPSLCLSGCPSLCLSVCPSLCRSPCPSHCLSAFGSCSESCFLVSPKSSVQPCFSVPFLLPLCLPQGTQVEHSEDKAWDCNPCCICHILVLSAGNMTRAHPVPYGTGPVRARRGVHDDGYAIRKVNRERGRALLGPRLGLCQTAPPLVMFIGRIAGLDSYTQLRACAGGGTSGPRVASTNF